MGGSARNSLMSQSFGNYQLEKKLATGGMAEVWLAKQTGIEGFQRHVVIKRILPHLAEDPEFVQMFLNEAKIASRFNHPNIAQIYDLGEHGGTYFIAMEFIHGEDLGRVMRRAWSMGQWVAQHIALRVIADACGGLHYAHSRTDEQGRPLRVVHRDISPQNILVSFDGAVKLVDFGIAKAADQASVTKSGAIKGKFAYMAPEQAAGKPVDGRTDLFALGLVLYELVTGVRPLKRDSELATLQAALECNLERPSNVAEVPAALDEVVMRALARAPDDRYRDAREFQKAIEQHLLSSGQLATSVEVSELMETLFADRLAEESRLGAPIPSAESSTGTPASASYPGQVLTRAAPSEEPAPPRRPTTPGATLDDGVGERTTGRADGVNDDEGPAAAREPSNAGRRVPRAEPARATRSSRSDVIRVPVEGDAAAPARPAERRRTRDMSPTGAAGDAAPPRHKTSGSLKRRTGATPAMPEAPPRRSRSNVEAIPAADSSTSGTISNLVDVQGLRSRQQSRLKALLVVLALIGAVVLIVIFQDSIRAGLTRAAPAAEGVPLRLTVISNPPTVVTVVPRAGDGARQPLELGRTPITEQSGAFVGDTVVLSNDDRGIRYETVLAAGAPNELRLIDQEFKESVVKIRVKPALKGATVWRGATKLGQVNMALSLFPGTHALEVHADQLGEPVPFELRIAPGQRTVDREIDVSSRVQKAPP
jgi:serine/threonine protein kinase